MSADRDPDDGHQTQVITSRWDLRDIEVAYRMFERWRQENFFKYMRELRVDQRGHLMGFLYIDGHVRAYHGQRAIASKAYVARRHLAMPASTDYWINDRSGDPLLVVTGEAALSRRRSCRSSRPLHQARCSCCSHSQASKLRRHCSSPPRQHRRSVFERSRCTWLRWPHRALPGREYRMVRGFPGERRIGTPKAGLEFHRRASSSGHD
jgi:hypothetical protein